jgi:hypothetical protein
VIQISYTAKTWTTAKGSAQQFVFPSNVTSAIMNNSAILIYMTNGTPNNATSYGWYAIPGIVPQMELNMNSTMKLLLLETPQE